VNVKITRNADQTITVRVGSYRETISADKGPMELLDAVRWAAITGGATVDEERLWELLQTIT
jgi:hypothetical protein